MKVLVIDDDEGARRTVSLLLEDEDYEVLTASGGEEGLEAAREEAPDLILCDVRMPGMDGMEFLRTYREEGGRALVIMMTAYGSHELAVEAMQEGAYDYVGKPFSGDELLLVLRKAEERENLRREVDRLRREVDPERRHPEIVARSEVMKQAIDLADRVAPHPSTVLISGESGTGKELFARLIHRNSQRRDASFVPVNCGAIPENLLESELFGHTKGSFTGADSDRAGLFEEADGGTLFLDEIGELPQQLQVKLLRALQEGEIRRVGASTERDVDVRVLAATARDLEADVEAGDFRSDLYYRINVVKIHLPPLRHRREDIPLLARHFLEDHNRELDLRFEEFDPEAMERMMEYPWPGNVRELENAVERAMVLSEPPTVQLQGLPEAVRDPAAVSTPAPEQLPADELSVKKRTAELERRLIARALEITEGNKTEAAELLDLSYRALLYKIKDYNLDE